MLPRWHVLLGGIFALLILIAAPYTNIAYILLFFLASFLIDFDHYLCAVINTGRLNLKEAFEYHRKMDALDKERRRKGLRERGDFHIFHTIEFHILVGLSSLLWTGFFYIFLGMVFHSLCDLYSLLYSKEMYRREFFFIAWVLRKITRQ